MKVLFRRNQKIFYILRMYWSLQDWRIKQHTMKVIWNRQ